MRDLLQYYLDNVNSVPRHSKCNSAYCQQADKNGTEYCRFHYSFDESPVTNIKYNEVSNIAGVSFRPEIDVKRNSDIQLIIDQYGCIEYLAKYASKVEKYHQWLEEQ